MSRVFDTKKEADVFAAQVHGFIEITSDDRMNKQFIVFYKKEGLA